MLALLGLPLVPAAAEPVPLRESLTVGSAYRIETSVRISGRIRREGSHTPESVVTGTSRTAYVERILPAGPGETFKTIRHYQTVEKFRSIDDATEEATLRPAVRRLVLIARNGQRAPFSPDGPLTWAEIDLIRTEVFVPHVVTELLPSRPVQVGDRWPAGPLAVRELTDLETIDAGELTLEAVGWTTVNQRKVLRLRLGGTVRGHNALGYHRHHLDGTVYYDPALPGLVYLSLKGTHELLDPQQQVIGVVEGTFTLSRVAVDELPKQLTDKALGQIDLQPTVDNTLLLFEDATLGLRFLYPRGWRVGMIRGPQVAVDHARGSGLLLTVEPAEQLPTAEAYLEEVKAFIQKRNVQLQLRQAPVADARAASRTVRFSLEAQFGMVRERLEYAVVRDGPRGVTVAGRLHAADVEQLLPEFERIVRSIRLLPVPPR